MADIKVPLLANGLVIGEALVSKDGTIINAEIHDSETLPGFLRYAMHADLLLGVSIAPVYNPGFPVSALPTTIKKKD